MEVLNQFGINPVLLAAQVVNFLILLFILKKFLYGPILKVLEERKKTIAESLKNAEEIEKKLLQTQEDREKRLVKAAQEGQQIIKDATETATQIIEDGKKKAEEIIADARRETQSIIQVERQRLHQEVQNNVADIVAQALQKVTGKVIDKKNQSVLVQKAIKEIQS